MAIIFNLNRGRLRDTNGEYLKSLDRKHKRIRSIGGSIGTSPITSPVCDNSICNGAISCGKNLPSDCVLEVACDTTPSE